MTPCAAATTSGVGLGETIAFNAQGVFVKGKKSELLDLTNSPAGLWTSTDLAILEAPPKGMGGLYTGQTTGCACAKFSTANISNEVGVGVNIADLSTCPLCPTPTSTPTPAAHSAAADTSVSAPSPTASAPLGGDLQWAFDAVAPVRGPIVPTADGHVYFITTDGVLHALDSRGRQIFQRPAGGLAPAVAPDGTVYVQGTGRYLYALKANGTAAWRVDAGTGNGSLAASDTAVYSSSGGDLIAASAPGQIDWRTSLGNLTTGAVFPGGVIVAADGGAVSAVSPSGAILWTFSPAGGFTGSLAVEADAVFAGSGSGTVYALDAASGAELWQVNTGAPVISGPSLAPSNAVYFGSDALYALTLAGNTAWTVQSAPAPFGLAAVGTSGVFDASVDGSAAMFDSTGALLWGTRSFGAVARVAISPSGVLYVGSTSGRIFAVK
jgi:eukaryotic-like serine/threonine-protein kinase